MHHLPVLSSHRRETLRLYKDVFVYLCQTDPVMKHIILSVALVLLSALSATAEDYDWKGGWILPTDMLSKPNIWISFRKEFDAETLPQSLKARIGVDSRYWLWINGEKGGG